MTFLGASPGPRLPLPPALMMSEPGSFAQLTLTQRWPAIVRRIITENDFSAAIAHPLEALIHELQRGQVRQLQDSGPDAADWAVYLKPWLGKPWVEIPWFFAEVYFYRRILEATQYFQGESGHRLDPFAGQKQAGLATALPDTRVMVPAVRSNLGVETALPDAHLETHLTTLIHSSLWGNRADLSLQPTASASQVQGRLETNMAQTHILVDDTALAGRHLVQSVGGRVDVIADNAGFELICDLLLVDFLLRQGLADSVYLHLKSHPTFVSDATIPDVQETLQGLGQDLDLEVRSLAHSLNHFITAGQLHLCTHPFWTAPLSFWEMPAPLSQDLAQSSLVIVKGDANYRRLLGDRHWQLTTPFADIVGYFPAPLLALRSLKSEIGAGLQAAPIASLNQLTPDWLINGQWGIVQFVPR